MSAPHNDPPQYWRYEVSGVLAPVIEAYLQGEALDPHQVGIMRAYLAQWINSSVWAENDDGSIAGLRDMIESLHSVAQIRTWLHKAMDIGIDPL